VSADREVTRIVRSWLEEGVTALPDRVLDNVLDQVPATRQRRSWWPAWRLPYVNTQIRIALAAAVVVIFAVIGINVIPRTGGVGGPAAPTPTPTLAPTDTPIDTLIATYPLLSGQASLNGRYKVGGELTSHVTVAVPAAWSTDTDWVVIGPKGNQAPDGMAIRFYTVGQVFKNPVAISKGVLTPPVGPTAADLAAAIVGDPAWHATGPTNVTIDGRQGLRVHFTIPTSSGLGADGQFDMFALAGVPDIYGFSLGQVFDLYMVDVAGERVVIDAFHFAGTSASDLAAQQAVLDSIQIDRNP
jgi:hypothetical protein